uniref:Uncharacterized protein n=1 Tax=Aegilops tauschii subsp. strangulata TaxID=200361 RepID=A0A453PIG5_AEGTS
FSLRFDPILQPWMNTDRSVCCSILCVLLCCRTPMDLAAGGGFWRTNLRCRRWVLVLCSARAGGAGGVCSSTPRAAKRSCPELKHVHADPPRQVPSFHGRGGQRPGPRRRRCQPRTRSLAPNKHFIFKLPLLCFCNPLVVQ